MANFEAIPVLVGAIQYSLAYMLCGGGVVGAVVVYIVARMLGK